MAYDIELGLLGHFFFIVAERAMGQVHDFMAM